MTLVAMHKLIGGVAATAVNGGGGGNGAGGGRFCCSYCRRQKQCCGDLVIKLAIAALVCISLCYVCFLVETQRRETDAKAVAAQQQQDQQQHEELLRAAFAQQRQDNGFDGDGDDGSGEGDLIIPAQKRYDETPPLLLFHSDTNAMDDHEGNAIKRFTTPTGANDTNVIEIISDDSDWLASEEMLLPAKVDSPTVLTSAAVAATPQLHDISSSEWSPHRIPLLLADDNDEESERRLLEAAAPPTIEWIAESAERYFPHELAFETSSNEDASLTADSAVQPQTEQVLLSNYDNDNYIRAKPQNHGPTLAPLPLLARSAFVTPLPPPASLDIESILESLFGNVANIIRPTTQKQQKQKQYQQNRGGNDWLRHFNC